MDLILAEQKIELAVFNDQLEKTIFRKSRNP